MENEDTKYRSPIVTYCSAQLSTLWPGSRNTSRDRCWSGVACVRFCKCIIEEGGVKCFQPKVRVHFRLVKLEQSAEQDGFVFSDYVSVKRENFGHERLRVPRVKFWLLRMWIASGKVVYEL